VLHFVPEEGWIAALAHPAGVRPTIAFYVHDA
jgi:hypothetical protein